MITSTIRKWRIPLTRVMGLLIIITISFSRSAWENNLEVVTHLLFLCGCVFAGIGSLGRLWCSLYIAGYKQEKLITVGPYSMSRNPLYFFSLIGILGVGMTTETFTIPALFVLAFALVFPAVIMAEEAKLKEIFGEEFTAYMRSTPRFFPKLSLLNEPQEYIVNPQRFKKHIFSALWFIWFIGIMEAIEGLHEMGWSLPFFKVF